MRQANAVRAHWANVYQEQRIAQERAGASQVSVNTLGNAPASQSAPEGFLEKLTKLGELKSAGLLTDEEFAAAKAKLLDL